MRPILFFVGLVTVATPCLAAAEDLAIVVQKSFVLESISKADLQKIFLQQTKKTGDGVVLIVLMREKGSPERSTILSQVYRLTEAGLDAYFLKALYTGDSLQPPRVVPSSMVMKRIISKTPGAIGYVALSDVDDTVKVLKIDEGLPGSDGYPLHLGIK